MAVSSYISFVPVTHYWVFLSVFFLCFFVSLVMCLYFGGIKLFLLWLTKILTRLRKYKVENKIIIPLTARLNIPVYQSTKIFKQTLSLYIIHFWIWRRVRNIVEDIHRFTNIKIIIEKLIKVQARRTWIWKVELIFSQNRSQNRWRLHFQLHKTKN